MNIGIGADHRGANTARMLSDRLKSLGHDVRAYSALSGDTCDYPIPAYSVGTAVAKGEVERGVLICGTGIGMCIAANKVRGVRAASCHDTIAAEMCRRHNDANVLCLSADLLGEELMVRMVRIFLETPFEAGRHARRVEKICKIESEMRDPT